MKIVIATAVYHPMTNGVAVFSYNLAHGLARRGNEVIVLCPSQTGKNYGSEDDGVKVYYLKSIAIKVYPDQIHGITEPKRFLGIKWPKIFYKYGFRVSLFPSKEVRQILDSFKPDVVHIQVSDPIGLSVASYARKKKIPIVTTEHNQPEVFTEPLKIPKMIKGPVEALLRSYFVNRQSKSDFVTMPTRRAIEKLILSQDKEFTVPIAAVSNGVNLDNFRPREVDEKVYRKYGIKKEEPVVLYVGRVDPEKNIGMVLKAFKAVLKEVPKAKLLIVGEGVDRINLEKKARQEGIMSAVRFLGRIMPPELYDLYNLGTVFVTASEVETQGIVLVEAAASGLPLIAVEGGAVAEICINEKNGFLCQPANVEEMSRAIVRILEDKKMRGRFSEESIKIAKEHDFENTLDKFLNIYRRVQIERKKKN